MAKQRHKIFLLTLILISSISFCQQKTFFTDTSHFSKTFGHQKNYRLYLPEGYENSNKTYPVIFFFHGWGGRHFKDDNALLEYEKIKSLVDKYNVILVMWDGNIDTTEPRPYNTGAHENVKYEVQMKDYFPELVSHIDSSYRTLNDRQHRGIIGFSMGGFMSFYLAGKYPERISAAVSLAGSPEFFVGYPGNHTLYPVRYTFKNLQDVNIRMHNGDSDILYYLNDEVNEGAKWEGKALDYWKFHGPHMVDYKGETKVFESAIRFITKTFDNPIDRKPRWSHYDLYPNFDIWGYEVKTNKKVPGFIFLTNVDKDGFGIYTHQWLPCGPAVELDSISVITSPLYTAGKSYDISIFDFYDDTTIYTSQKADASGRLLFFFTHPRIEVGISEEQNNTSFIAAGYAIEKSNRYLFNNKKNSLTIQLANRLISDKDVPVKVTLTTRDKSVKVSKPVSTVVLPARSHYILLPTVIVAVNKQTPRHADPPQIKFELTIETGNKKFTDDIIVPVLYDAPLFDSVQIDDNTVIREKAFGTGNGNKTADAGETIMLYSGTHRLRLYTEDKWIIKETLTDEIIPARWPDGFTLNSLVTISPDCPDGHVIEFYGSYETKSFNPIERKTTWGKLKLTVHNKRNSQ